MLSGHYCALGVGQGYPDRQVGHRMAKFKNVCSDLCVIFEDSKTRASVHAQIRSNLTTCITILQMRISKPKQIVHK